MTASDSEVPVPASTGAAVRFPFPPMLFAAPLALALAADRWVLRLPLPRRAAAEHEPPDPRSPSGARCLASPAC